jgi:hypothetical protein
MHVGISSGNQALTRWAYLAPVQPKSGRVLRLVVGGGVRLALFGIAVALALTQPMTDMLYGVRATDPVTFSAVAIVLAVTSLLACYIPARRAMDEPPPAPSCNGLATSKVHGNSEAVPGRQLGPQDG